MAVPVHPNCEYDSIIGVKVGAVCFTLAIGLLGSMLATCYAKGGGGIFFAVSNVFASGEFMGVALLHLLWASNHGLEKLVIPNYPLSPLIFLFSVLATAFAHHLPCVGKRGGGEGGGATGGDQQRHALGALFTVILAVHSIFGGIVIGLQTSLHSTIINFIAFGAHKGVAAFALGLDLSRKAETMPLCRRLWHCAIFAVSTPIGIGVGTGIIAGTSAKTGHITSAVFGAAAGGCFLYIALKELMEDLEESVRGSPAGPPPPAIELVVADPAAKPSTAAAAEGPRGAGLKSHLKGHRLQPVQVLFAFTAGVAVMAVIFPLILFPGGASAEHIAC